MNKNYYIHCINNGQTKYVEVKAESKSQAREIMKSLPQYQVIGFIKQSFINNLGDYDLEFTSQEAVCVVKQIVYR